jgi:lysophospholipase L1-like esterase
MNSFRTLVKATKPDFTISYQTQMVSIGSCFSETIGLRFQQNKFNININPFGQQYNPLSIASAIHLLVNAQPLSESDLVQHDELWHSFAHHGSFSKKDKEQTLQNINNQLLQAAEDLRKADVLFLTFGTSHVFELKETGKVVSNCHKMPSTLFNQRLASPEEIVLELGSALQKLKNYNPKLRTAFTVSPIRYFAFGHYENSVGKAHLFTAIHQLQKKFTGSYYFPAYEMVTDDLRDYRFYADDMLHPNHKATDYVWEHLCETMLVKESLELMKEVKEIAQAAKHRPRNPTADAHKKFSEKYLAKIHQLKQKYALDFTEEEQALKKYAANY